MKKDNSNTDPLIDTGKHTPGICQIDDDGFIYIKNESDYVTFADLDCNELDIDEREANKDRFCKAWNEYDQLQEEAKALSAKNKELREALQPFEKLANEIFTNSVLDKDQTVYGYNKAMITMQNLRDVVTALNSTKEV